MDEIRALVVVKPAPDQNLVSLEDVRLEMGVTDCSQDALLQRYIAQASAAVASFTGRVWRQETVTETWYGSWFDLYYSRFDKPRPLLLARYPVTTVVAVNEGGVDLTDGQWLLDGPAGLLYRLTNPPAETVNPLIAGDPDPPENWTSGLMPWAGWTVSVTYTAGYATTKDVPADVQQAASTMVQHRYSARGRDPALRSIDIPGVQAETYWVGTRGDYNGGMAPEIAGLLNPHIDMRS